ncbi:MAG: LuxR C-terminal-related transcriptional regulator [Propionibacteriaceae bacterium]|nr:LuxR C-terminal-related transcriptional regulator [Propionibacteriaceae bacterium]
MQRFAIGLVDDHFAVSLGITALLEETEDLRLVATARTVAELLDTGTPVDLVLLDLSLADRSMPEDNVAELAKRGIPSLAYTSGENAWLIRSAARGGVRGIARKSHTPEQLIAAIRGCLRDDAEALTNEWAAAVDSDPGLDAVGLSERQREVLELFACGESAKRVASQTGLSITTVNDYLLRIRAKYANQGRAAHTKVDLYKRAVEDGVLPPPSREP